MGGGGAFEGLESGRRAVLWGVAYGDGDAAVRILLWVSRRKENRWLSGRAEDVLSFFGDGGWSLPLLSLDERAVVW